MHRTNGINIEWRVERWVYCTVCWIKMLNFQKCDLYKIILKCIQRKYLFKWKNRIKIYASRYDKQTKIMGMKTLHVKVSAWKANNLICEIFYKKKKYILHINFYFIFIFIIYFFCCCAKFVKTENCNKRVHWRDVALTLMWCDAMWCVNVCIYMNVVMICYFMAPTIQVFLLVLCTYMHEYSICIRTSIFI